MLKKEEENFPRDSNGELIANETRNREAVAGFLEATGSKANEQRVCAVCEERCLASDGSMFRIDDIPNIHVLSGYPTLDTSNETNQESATFSRGDSVVYLDKEGPITCTVAHVDTSAGEPFYTLNHPSGNERQTTHDRLRSVGSPESPDRTQSNPRLFLGDIDCDGKLHVCRSCCSCLQKKTPEPPKNSIFYTDLGGEVPDCLRDLTLPEQLMISPIICKSYVLKLVSYGSKESAMRGIKGNSIAFMQDVQDVIRRLPCLDSTTDYLKVCFVGDETTPLPVQQIKKLLTVRREKVKAALTWLCANNVAFKEAGITMDHTTIDSLPLDDIPDDILTNITRSGDVDSATAEGSSYVPSDPSSTEVEEDSIPIERSGVIDVDTTQLSQSTLFSAASDNLKFDEKTMLKVKSSSRVANPWDNPMFWPLAFPTLFPYGTGGCNDIRPKLHIWIRHLLNLRDNRFRLHYSFMFVVYSILNIREVCKNTRFVLAREFKHNGGDPLVIDSDTLVKTFAEVKKSKSQNPQITDPKVRKLMSQLKTVCKNVKGSDFHRRYTSSLTNCYTTYINTFLIKINVKRVFVLQNESSF